MPLVIKAVLVTVFHSQNFKTTGNLNQKIIVGKKKEQMRNNYRPQRQKLRFFADNCHQSILKCNALLTAVTLNFVG